MAGNTTAAAADFVWVSVGVVRGAESKLDFQLLEFSQSMSPQDVAKQVITAPPAYRLLCSACVVPARVRECFDLVLCRSCLSALRI